jgi:DNA-binding response OmpR family regulator
MPARVLLVCPDDAPRASLADALGRAGLDVVACADTDAALDALASEPGSIRAAVVSQRQGTGKPHGIASALTMRGRHKIARIVLLVDRPDDIKSIDITDACSFSGIVVFGTDTSRVATEILRLVG